MHDFNYCKENLERLEEKIEHIQKKLYRHGRYNSGVSSEMRKLFGLMKLYNEMSEYAQNKKMLDVADEYVAAHHLRERREEMVHNQKAAKDIMDEGTAMHHASMNGAQASYVNSGVKPMQMKGGE